MLTNNMAKLWGIVAFLLIVGCGRGPSASSDGSSQPPDSSNQQVVSTPGTQEGDAQMYVGAKLVDTTSEMGVCDSTKYRQLIYVIETGEFYFCSKSNQWNAIDLKGPKGDTGSQGVAGSNGSAGRDGRDGTQGTQGSAGRDGRDGSSGTNGVSGSNGSNGTNGIDGENASNLVWRHPVTDKKWFLGRLFLYSALFSIKDQICPDKSHNPTSEEFKDAILAGLWNQILPTIKLNSADLGKVIIDQIDISHLEMGYPNANTNQITSEGNYLQVYSVCVVD